MDLNTIIKIIAILIILTAIWYLIKPDFVKALMRFFAKGNRIYIPALLRFTLAVVFLLAAGQSNHPRIIAVFGIIFIISGLLIVILGPNRIRVIFDWYLNQPTFILRVLAVITLAIGALILYAA